MINFCLMTSSNYLTKALVMYDSLLGVCGDDFHIYYFSFDEDTLLLLNKLNYANITGVSLDELEEFDKNLLAAKKERSSAEYFFTCTPQIIAYSLEKFNLDHVVYIDADLVFYNDPGIILNELGNNSVLITEHRFYPDVNDIPQGKYCVQFVPFKNTKQGNYVLQWWKEKCLEWCYLRAEDGKWADQGYLNEWSERFEGVVTAQDRGVGVATWNMHGYDFSYDDVGKLKGFSKEINKDVDVIFYHFAGLKIYDNGLISTGIEIGDTKIYKNIYQKYIQSLIKKQNELSRVSGFPMERFHYPQWPESKLKFRLKKIRKLFYKKVTDYIIINTRKQS